MRLTGSDSSLEQMVLVVHVIVQLARDGWLIGSDSSLVQLILVVH